LIDYGSREVESFVIPGCSGLNAGPYEVDFPAFLTLVRDGTNYPSGVYYYKLTVENYNETKKMVLVK